jgi:hypothetical protein
MNTYYTAIPAFDVNKFNQDFDAYLARQKAERLLREEKFLGQKQIEIRDKLLHELTFIELLINMKNEFFDILDDMASLNISLETFTKRNRLFYIGLLLLIFAIMLVCVNIIFYNEKSDSNVRNEL